MKNVDIHEISKYITRVYSVKTLVNLNCIGLDQICFTNKKLDTPFCSLYFDICPEWGYAPNELLIHYEKERKDHSGASGSIVYDGIESIDWLMKNIFDLEKKYEQFSLF